MLHYNGTSVGAAGPGPARRGLRDLWGTSRNDYWVIDQKGRLLHSTGDQRVEVPPAGDLDLQTLWGSGPEDIWAGGKGVLRGNLSDGFRRVDQGALTEVTKLAGSAPNNVWANTPAGVFAYNGANWQQRTEAPVLDLWVEGPSVTWLAQPEGVGLWNGRYLAALDGEHSRV